MSKNNLPGFLIGGGIIGFFGAIVTAVQATPKAMINIANRAEELGYDDYKKMPFKEKFKCTWKEFIFPGVLVLSSTASIISGGVMQNKEIKNQNEKISKVSAVAAASSSALAAYQAKVVETVGEREAQKIRAAVDKEAYKNKAPVYANAPTSQPAKELCYVNDKGTTIWDRETGRKFQGDIDEIKKIASNLDASARNGIVDVVTVNSLYSSMDLDWFSLGEEVGWDYTKGQKFEPEFTAQLDEKDRPVIVLSYNVYYIGGE